MARPILRIGQLVTLGLIFGLAVSVLGTAGHALSQYNAQSSSNAWWLPLWADHFTTSGTKALIGSAATAIVLNGAYLASTFIPKLKLDARPTLRAALALVLGLPVAFITLATIVFNSILNRNAPETDTIQTWTCRYSQKTSAPVQTMIPSSQSNDGFQQICIESKFAHFGSVTIFLLQCGLLGMVTVRWFSDMFSKRKSDKGWQDDSSLEKNGPAH